MFDVTYGIVLIGIAVALWFCWHNHQKGKRLPSGSKEIHQLAQRIRNGANTFLKSEFKVSIPVMLLMAMLFATVFHPFIGLSYVLGVAMSSLSGIVGMKAAVTYNEKVVTAAWTAVREGLSQDEAEEKAGKIAIRGGTIMGFGVESTVLFGLFVVVAVGGQLMSFMEPENMQVMTSFVPLFGIKFQMFPQLLTCFALGCSTVAVFNRLGGGIYTKGADMGADLVGKTEMNLSEDDSSNPAAVADLVGDNIGDVAGMGSDLNESKAGVIVAAMIIAVVMYLSSLLGSSPISVSLFHGILLYPLAFAGVGLLACFIGIVYVLEKEKISNVFFNLMRKLNLHVFAKKRTSSVTSSLNASLWVPAAIIAVGTLFLSIYFFKGRNDLNLVSFAFGWISPWLAALMGVAAGIVMGVLAERYTSEQYKSTKHVADLAKQGPALVCVGGIELGWRSCMPYGITFAAVIIVSNYMAGLYGVAMAGVGMLSFVAATVTVDTYGPIVDNAGGISEMCKLPEKARAITNSLDSFGNTTAAIGKGFAIGSGVLAALSVLVSFTQAGDISLDLTNPLLLGGSFIGATLMYWLSGNMLEAVCNNAAAMVDEVREQFPLIKNGKEPDSDRCISVCTKHALKSMRKPVLVSLLAPAVGGLIGGPVFVGGIIAGAILVAVVMAIATANSGGAWDNAKKYVKTNETEFLTELDGDVMKYREMQNASIVGDTLGDGFKDVVGVNMDIIIKMMATLALVLLPVFARFNLISLITRLISFIAQLIAR